MLEIQSPCFKEFPDQCIGCPEYSEIKQNQASQLTMLTGLGMMYPTYMEKTIKECKRFHKRKVEYLR